MRFFAAATFAAAALVPSIAQATTSMCSTVSACIFGSNASSGAGVQGVGSSGFGVAASSTSSHGVDGTSTSSFGVVGRTLENATSITNARAGVYGTDSSSNSNSFNSGVAGLSKNGLGVLGESSNGNGLQGLSLTSGAFSTVPTYGGIGVFGMSNAGPGIYGITSGNQSDSFGVGTYSTQNGITSLASFAAGDHGSTFYARTHSDGYLMVGASFENGNVASIDGNGNIVIAGTLTEHGTSIAVTPTSTGQRMATYGNRSSAPTLEDMGEAQLTNGHATIALDSRFASAIDPTSKYYVFLTPEGPNGGLYVSTIGRTGFAVSDSSGRGSVAFFYRIVAKPYGSTHQRLEIIPPAGIATDAVVPQPPNARAQSQAARRPYR